MARMKRTDETHGVDSTVWTHVPFCEVDGCEWRGVANNDRTAWRMLAAHLRSQHPDRHMFAQRARVNATG